MPTVEWDIPFRLVTDAGTLTLNAATGDRYILNHEACLAAPQLRTSRDNLPRTDGATIHHAFKTGYHMVLSIELWKDNAPAMGLERQAMLDALDPHITALLNADVLTDSGGRVIWTPSGYTDDRMLDGCRLGEWPSISYNGLVATVTLALQTRFPYGIDFTEIQTPIVGAGSVVINNAGTTEQWPVFRVFGFLNNFTLTNETTGFTFVWDDLQVGSGGPIAALDYAEVDMFRNTVYLNGNEANLKPGVVLSQSDFWSLAPGDNTVTYDNLGGAGSVALSSNAWA